MILSQLLHFTMVYQEFAMVQYGDTMMITGIYHEFITVYHGTLKAMVK
jgi:hypothetical protein